MRRQFNVVMEKMCEELKGNSCIPTEVIQPKKQIISSCSFGKPVMALSDLEEALSNHAAIAGEKLRKQGSMAHGVAVFLNTNRFSKKEVYYCNNNSISFPTPTIDTTEIIAAAGKLIRPLYREGYKYQKIGLMLLDLVPATHNQVDMFNSPNQSRKKLMQIVDQINKSYGKNTVFYAAQGIKRDWQAKFERRTPRCTTRWDELLAIRG